MFSWLFPFVKFQHTAARRRLAQLRLLHGVLWVVSTHSRPKAAGHPTPEYLTTLTVSTHSRPKAAGPFETLLKKFVLFQHTAARRRLEKIIFRCHFRNRFQHTAARRRLAILTLPCATTRLFQHTAARRRLAAAWCAFTTKAAFQHTAARRRLEPLSKALLHQVSQPRVR